MGWAMGRGAKLAGGSRRRKLPGLILMTDAVRLPDPLAAMASLAPGAAVILRHYEAPDRRALAGRLSAWCRARRILLLVAADTGLAAAVRAGGVHLPEYRIGAARGIRRRRPAWLITAAVHSAAALTRAQRAGVDAVLLSPVFATPSHPDARPLGVLRFAGLVRHCPLRVFALGGIGPRNVRRLKGTGAAGIAGISGVTSLRIRPRPAG